MDTDGDQYSVNLARVKSLLGPGVMAVYVAHRRPRPGVPSVLDADTRVVVAVFGSRDGAQRARMTAHQKRRNNPERYRVLFEYSSVSNPAVGGWPKDRVWEKLLFRGIQASSERVAVAVFREKAAEVLSLDVCMASESRSANAKLVHVNGSPGYNVWVTVYGQDSARKVAEALRGTCGLPNVNRDGKVWVGGFCGTCQEWGHKSDDRACSLKSFLVRLDSQYNFNQKILRRLQGLTGAVDAFSGAHGAGRALRKPKRFAHLKFNTQEARRKALSILMFQCVHDGTPQCRDHRDGMTGPGCPSAVVPVACLVRTVTWTTAW